MSSTHALTPIAGTNGYQQQIAIDPGQPLHLSVSNASGEIRVAGSDQAGVWVVVRRADGDTEHDPDVIPVTVDVDGNQISIHPDWGVAGGVAALARKIKNQLQNGLNPNDWDLSGFRLHPDLNYDIRVQLPRALAEGSKVIARTASGQLFINDVEAVLVAATASGRAQLSNVRGKVIVNSASGAITIDGAHGSLEANTASGSISVAKGAAWTALRTASGSISIERFTMKNARLATVSGSVKAAVIADNAQEYSISTVSGSVRLDLTLPATVTTSLTSRSVSGSAKPGSEWTADGKRRWTIGAGEPGPSFSVKTVSGSLKASARLDAGLAPRNEPLPAPLDPDDHDHDHDGVDILGAGHRNAGGGFDADANIEGMAAWARDFAQDFKKNFASLATPPTPPTSPTAPMAPVPPVPPVPPTGARDETTAMPSQSWTWSSGSGSPPPASASTGRSGQETMPLDGDAPPANVPSGSPAATDGMDAERLRVLEALERGEIDIDEALAKLDPDDTQGA